MSVLIYAVLILPGLAYILQYERNYASGKVSVFRESVTVVAVSLLLLILGCLVLLGISFAFSEVGNQLDRALRSPSLYLTSHPRHVLIIVLSYVIIATFVAWFIVPHKYFIRGMDFMNNKKSRLSQSASGWQYAFSIAPGGEAYPKGTAHFVTLALKDGSIISGQRIAHTASIDEDQEASILLGPPLTIQGKDLSSLNMQKVNCIVVHAKEVSFLSVTAFDKNGIALKYF